ncbi:MAG: hypothetical protein MR016_11170 [Agathobacter sp.]|nr:hypothetical protein [Agathobacter sp.]
MEKSEYAVSKAVHCIILDTPAAAHVSHKFYERAGFTRISTEELPIPILIRTGTAACIC